MRYNFINNKNNKKIIVFFNGWAMNESAVSHLDYCDYDIIEIYDYSNFDFDFSIFDFEKYDEKYLIAWSMGVYTCNLFYETFKNFNKKIAINGTSNIIDNFEGIPKRVYDITLKLLNEENLDKFIKNMFDNGNLNPEIKITRTIEELKEELIAIKNIKLEKYLKFDLAIISNDDRIIPSKNQIAYFKDKTEIKIINSTHCPFKMYKSWGEFIC